MIRKVITLKLLNLYKVKKYTQVPYFTFIVLPGRYGTEMKGSEEMPAESRNRFWINWIQNLIQENKKWRP